MKKLFLIISTLLAIMLMPLALAVPMPHPVYGKVYGTVDTSGALFNIQVQVKNVNTGKIATTQTAVDGSYVIDLANIGYSDNDLIEVTCSDVTKKTVVGTAPGNQVDFFSLNPSVQYIRVEVPVEKIVEKEVIREVIKEVPVEVIKEVQVIKEVPVEVIKEICTQTEVKCEEKNVDLLLALVGIGGLIFGAVSYWALSKKKK